MMLFHFNMVCAIVLWIFVFQSVVVLTIPDRYQNTIPQQSFQSVLYAIEERLRNLDHIYSVQLSETLHAKLDQYNRKLDSLDTKIIRLEAMVMMNLDRLSENISTKNHKDDMARTQIYNKLETMHDGLNERLDAMDRKCEASMEKIQKKVDSTEKRLERMEEDMLQRNMDTEAELSEALGILETLKSSSTEMDLRVANISSDLKDTLQQASMIDNLNTSMYDLFEDFNSSMSRQFLFLQDRSTASIDATEDTNTALTSMRVELKEDFNAYANKVADMNADIWKRNDLAEEALKAIEAIANSTKSELQNGIRALMLQIGKGTGKGIISANDKNAMESLKRGVNLSLEKIITNQELFLESCHRVQMDESQIESEISMMLGKLIDMLESKISIVLKDVKSIDKTLKSHDSRMQRSLHQANTNIVSLYDRTTKAYDNVDKELHNIKLNLESLFVFVENSLPGPKEINTKEDILNNISLNISKLLHFLNNNSTELSTKWDQLENQFSENKVTVDKVLSHIKNVTDMALNEGLTQDIHLTKDIYKAVGEIKLILANLQKTGFNCENRENGVVQKNSSRPKNCTDYGDLIDIRTGEISCNDPEISPGANEDLDKKIFDIFGSPPAALVPNTHRVVYPSSTINQGHYNQRWPHFSNAEFVNEHVAIAIKQGHHHRRFKPKLQSRAGDDEQDEEFDDSATEETTIGFTTEIPSTTESVVGTTVAAEITTTA
ncbi:hypothetical protein HUJ04_002807 [Dendroctonus ponderosae]|uniref:Uncharacterized protein n=2 Tax=Dendroctonus ponderosae TaxID=77166 RepID=A0AAR5QJE7_DENPD|nr:hypothetical protein HUJ04_002807 [Dendroctonus ponderosae]